MSIARSMSAPSVPAEVSSGLRATSSRKTFSALHMHSPGSPPPVSDELAEEEECFSPRSPVYDQAHYDPTSPSRNGSLDASKHEKKRRAPDSEDEAVEESKKPKKVDEEDEKETEAEETDDDDGPKTPTVPRGDYSDAELLAAVHKVVDARKAMNLIVGRPVEEALGAMEDKLRRIRGDVETVQGAIGAAYGALSTLSKRLSGFLTESMKDAAAELAAEPAEKEAKLEPSAAEPAEKEAKLEPSAAEPKA
jgi:hypothetical protein